jgi:hypothetical protein
MTIGQLFGTADRGDASKAKPSGEKLILGTSDLPSRCSRGLKLSIGGRLGRLDRSLGLA